MSFADVDALYGTANVLQGMAMLKARCEKGDNSCDVMWRLARCCYELAGRSGDKNTRKALILEGQKYALDGVALNSAEFESLRWAAVTTGQLTDFLGTKEKIQEGAKFKEYLDKALSINASEYTLLHMRGRYAFSVAGLTWLERKAAALLYSTPPSATYDEALADFLAAFEERPEWIENLFYIARCYTEKKDKGNAKKYLEMAVKLDPVDDSEREIISDAKKMLSKC